MKMKTREAGRNEHILGNEAVQEPPGEYEQVQRGPRKGNGSL